MKFDYKKISLNQSGKRNHEIDTISPHCAVALWDTKTLTDYFATTKRQASCNIAIGSDGKRGLSVPLTNRSWCTSDRNNDNRAVTIECASEIKSPNRFPEATLKQLVQTMIDICQEYGKNKLVYLPTAEQRKAYQPKQNEMKITLHRDYANKECPGDWLVSLLPELVEQINQKIMPKILYHVQVGAFRYKENADDLKKDLHRAGYSPFIKYDGSLYRVQVGAYANYENAEKTLRHLKNLDFSAYITK